MLVFESIYFDHIFQINLAFSFLLSYPSPLRREYAHMCAHTHITHPSAFTPSIPSYNSEAPQHLLLHYSLREYHVPDSHQCSYFSSQSCLKNRTESIFITERKKHTHAYTPSIYFLPHKEDTETSTSIQIPTVFTTCLQSKQPPICVTKTPF